VFDLTHKMPDNIKDDVRPFLDALVDRKGWDIAIANGFSFLDHHFKNPIPSSPGEPDTLSNGFAFKEIQHVFLEYFWKYGGVRQGRDHYPTV